MSPYFNTETGEMIGGDDLATEPALSAPLTEQDRQQQEDRERREAIGTGKTPAAETKLESATPHVIVSDPLQARDEIEKMIADKSHPAWDPSHPQHEVAQKRYLEFVMLERGANPLDPAQNPELGLAREGGRIVKQEDQVPVRVPQPSDEARAAFDLDDPASDAVIEHQEALVDICDRSGIGRQHPEGLIRAVGGAMEELARDPETDTPEHGNAELIRREGGQAEGIVRDAQEFVQLLYASGQPNLVAAAEDLIATSNHPGVLIEAARFYREIISMVPSGPLEELLLSRAQRWAQQQAAAKARTPKADEAPEDHVVSTGGRP